MHYEIIVTKNGDHLFATAPRSISNEIELIKLYTILRLKFIEADGYKLKVNKWETVGQPVDIDSLLKIYKACKL